MEHEAKTHPVRLQRAYHARGTSLVRRGIQAQALPKIRSLNGSQLSQLTLTFRRPRKVMTLPN